MANRSRKSRNDNRSCENCGNCIPLGEGDHLCDVNDTMVIEEYQPTDNYIWCGGKQWRG